MLFAQISPTAKTVTQIDPFTTTITEYNYMTAIVVPYGIGAPTVTFKIIFGNITDNAFYQGFSIERTFPSSTLSTWNADNSALLGLIATQIGTVASSFISTELGDLLY